MSKPRLPPLSIIPVFDEGDRLGFVYTTGLHTFGLPELLAVDVPVTDRGTAQTLFQALIMERLMTGLGIDHGYKCEIRGRWFTALVVHDETVRAAVIESMGFADLHAGVILVKPLFDDEEDKNEGGVGKWAEPMPKAPEGREKMRKGIIRKWRKQRDSNGFSTFHDGNKDNPSAWNVAPIPLLDALRGYPALATNWDMQLTKDETEYVGRHTNHMIRFAEAEMVSIDLCKAEKYMNTVALNLREAAERYKSGMKVVVPTASPL